MRENKANRKILKRFMSGVMAMAVALSMCMVMTPIRALAAGYIIGSNGTVVSNSNDGIVSIEFDGSASDLEAVIGIDTASKAIVLKGGTYGYFSIMIADYCKFKVQGTNKVTTVYVGSKKIMFEMSPGSSLEITKVHDDINGQDYTLQEAYTKGKIDITGGTVQNGKIVAGGELKVGDTSQESGKTTADSPTYKVTDNTEGKRSVTYEKPADNANGTEEVKAEVTLTDGNTYKVTAIDEGAFSNFKDKDKIKKIVVGDNVTEIGKNACKDLKNLTDVTFKDNLEIIGDSAFENTAITKVTLGKKVKRVGNRAYYNCGSLKKVTVKTAKLTKKGKVGKKAFGKTHKKMKVKMKMSKKDAKKAKAPTIKIFKSKRIGYVKTWSVK